MNIRLERVDTSNFRSLIKLKVAQHQVKYIASNMYTIAEAYVEQHLVPYAIMAGDEVVGLLASENNPQDNQEDRYWVPRFMIGEQFQRKGYGKAAMKLILEQLTQEPDCDRVRLSVVPENEQAIAFYTNIGFIKTGQINHGEEILEYFARK